MKNRYNVQVFYWGFIRTNDETINRNNIIDKYTTYDSFDLTRNINDTFFGIRLMITNK